MLPVPNHTLPSEWHNIIPLRNTPVTWTTRHSLALHPSHLNNTSFTCTTPLHLNDTSFTCTTLQPSKRHNHLHTVIYQKQNIANDDWLFYLVVFSWGNRVRIIVRHSSALTTWIAWAWVAILQAIPFLQATVHRYTQVSISSHSCKQQYIGIHKCQSRRW